MDTTAKQKILAIVGPTASGKTALSIRLAEEIGGEIISADSRQVYRGFDQTTVKVTPEEMRGIPHHLLDIADVSERISVAEYKKKAEEVIADIYSRGEIPILCGGTGYYIDAVLYDRTFPEVPENAELRKELSEKTAAELFEKLEALDPVRALSIEKENPRRLIRAIEIASALGSVPEIPVTYDSKFDPLLLGLRPKDDVLRSRIQNRISNRIDQIIAEVGGAFTRGEISADRADELGFDFSLTIQFIQGDITKEELAKRLEYGDWQYAKRQLRWFKRNPTIHWFENGESTDIVPLTDRWLNQ